MKTTHGTTQHDSSWIKGVLHCVSGGQDDLGKTNLCSKISREQFTFVVLCATALTAWGHHIQDYLLIKKSEKHEALKPLKHCPSHCI